MKDIDVIKEFSYDEEKMYDTYPKRWDKPVPNEDIHRNSIYLLPTRIKDKKGTKIYEHNIAEFKYKDEKLMGIVIYNEYKGRFEFRSWINETKKLEIPFSTINFDDFLVTGNVHTDPGLLG